MVGSEGRRGAESPFASTHLLGFFWSQAERAGLLDDGFIGQTQASALTLSLCPKCDLIEDHRKIYLYIAQDLQSCAHCFKEVQSSCQSACCLSVKLDGKRRNQHREKIAWESLFCVHVKVIFVPGILRRAGLSFTTVNSVFPLRLPLLPP